MPRAFCVGRWHARDRLVVHAMAPLAVPQNTNRSCESQRCRSSLFTHLKASWTQISSGNGRAVRLRRARKTRRSYIADLIFLEIRERLMSDPTTGTQINFSLYILIHISCKWRRPVTEGVAVTRETATVFWIRPLVSLPARPRTASPTATCQLSPPDPRPCPPSPVATKPHGALQPSGSLRSSPRTLPARSNRFPT